MQWLFAEVVEGLEDLASRELRSLGAKSLSPTRSGLRLQHEAPLHLAAEVRSVSALYLELRFEVPRPKALLGDEAMRHLSGALAKVARQGGMRSFRFAAAGADSPVFQRLAQSLSAASGLVHDPQEGSVLIRVRLYGQSRGARPRAARSGAKEPTDGWEVLLRLSERPLSTRPWRVCNRPGGVNATVAFAMNSLLDSAPGGTYLNLMCGSGTLLVERALTAPSKRLVGVDIDAAAVDCARSNLSAARLAGFELYTADLADLPQVLDGGFDELTADPPWGDAVGSHATNEALHRTLLATAAALAAPAARFVILSHEVRLLERLLSHASNWRVESSRRVAHGGHRPSMVLLRRV